MNFEFSLNHNVTVNEARREGKVSRKGGYWEGVKRGRPGREHAVFEPCQQEISLAPYNKRNTIRTNELEE